MLVFEDILCFWRSNVGEIRFFEGWEWDFGGKLMIFGYFLLTLQSQSILFWDGNADRSGLTTTKTTNYALYISYIRTLCGSQLHFLLYKGREWCFCGFWAFVAHCRGGNVSGLVSSDYSELYSLLRALCASVGSRLFRVYTFSNNNQFIH